MRHIVSSLMVMTLATLGMSAETQTPPTEKTDRPAIKINQDGKPDDRTNVYIRRGKEGPIGVLFIGDSITAGWITKAKTLWDKEFGHYQPANFATGGDRTQHILWRMDQGMLDGINPKVVVLMIGTNNIWTNSATNIIKGQTAIIDGIHRRLPTAKLLLVSVLPVRSESLMDNMTAINQALAKHDDGKRTRYVDISGRFLDSDGQQRSDLLPDGVHPDAEGYRIWADCMRTMLAEMMAD